MATYAIDSYLNYHGYRYSKGSISENDLPIISLSDEDKEILKFLYERYQRDWRDHWSDNPVLLDALDHNYWRERVGDIYLYNLYEFILEVDEGVRRADSMATFSRKEMNMYFSHYSSGYCFNYPSACYRLCCIWGVISCREKISTKTREKFLPYLESYIWDDEYFDAIKKAIGDYRTQVNEIKATVEAQYKADIYARMVEENKRMAKKIEQMENQIQMQMEMIKAGGGNTTHIYNYNAPVGQAISHVDNINSNDKKDGSERR